MTHRADMVDTEVMEKKRKCFWTKEQSLETGHICLWSQIQRALLEVNMFMSIPKTKIFQEAAYKMLQHGQIQS